jgi:ceramide glucosyltransferase
MHRAIFQPGTRLLHPFDPHHPSTSMAAAASAAGAASALSSLPSLLAALALAWYAAIWCISLLGLHTARRLYSPPIPASPLSSLADDVQRAAANGTPAHTGGASASPSAPGVSILRPLAGLDHNLLGNLCAAFEQRYPRDSFEIILSVRDEHDQALAVARDVAARYPEVKSRIVVGES